MAADVQSQAEFRTGEAASAVPRGSENAVGDHR